MGKEIGKDDSEVKKEKWPELNSLKCIDDADDDVKERNNRHNSHAMHHMHTSRTHPPSYTSDNQHKKEKLSLFKQIKKNVL